MNTIVAKRAIQDIPGNARERRPASAPLDRQSSLLSNQTVASQNENVEHLMKLLSSGGISLMAATKRLGLPDAGHTLAMMRERGVEMFRRGPQESAETLARVAKSFGRD